MPTYFIIIIAESQNLLSHLFNQVSHNSKCQHDKQQSQLKSILIVILKHDIHTFQNSESNAQLNQLSKHQHNSLINLSRQLNSNPSSRNLTYVHNLRKVLRLLQYFPKKGTVFKDSWSTVQSNFSFLLSWACWLMTSNF